MYTFKVDSTNIISKKELIHLNTNLCNLLQFRFNFGGDLISRVEILRILGYDHYYLLHYTRENLNARKLCARKLCPRKFKPTKIYTLEVFHSLSYSYFDIFHAKIAAVIFLFLGSN